MSRSLTIDTVGQALKDVFEQLDHAFDLPDATLDYRPFRADAWTMAEHLEHVCLVNHFLLIIIRKGVAIALERGVRLPVPEGESDLERLSPIAAPDSFPWIPPQHMIPTGAVPPAEIRQRLRDQRSECLSLLDSIQGGEGALHEIRMSVNSLGKIDMYQWLYFLAQHGRYHLHFFKRLADGPDHGGRVQ